MGRDSECAPVRACDEALAGGAPDAKEGEERGAASPDAATAARRVASAAAFFARLAAFLLTAGAAASPVSPFMNAASGGSAIARVSRCSPALLYGSALGAREPRVFGLRVTVCARRR